MLLKLDMNVLDLKGNPIPDKLSDTLANVLATATSGPPAKMITWAVNLMNNGEIEVNMSDLRLIEAVILENRLVINLAKAQLLAEIQKLKEG